MDFFSTRTDATVTPFRIKCFSIYDPSLSHNEMDSDKSLLVYFPPDVELNKQVSTIGMIQGMTQFVKEYTHGESLRHVALHDGMIVVRTFEDRFDFMLHVQFTKIEDDGMVEFRESDLAPVNYISELVRRGYDQFRLHNGSIHSLLESMSQEECMSFLSNWWGCWIAQLEPQISDDGVMKLLQSYRKSAIRCDSEMYPAACDLQQRYEFKDLLIWNGDLQSSEQFGLIYEHSKLLLPDSKLRLIQWLEESCFYGLSTESLTSSNITRKPTPLSPSLSEEERVYDPFKLALNTLSDVSNATGFTQGVNTGVRVVSSGFDYFNTMIPSWGNTETAMATPVVKQQDYDYLIGLNQDDTISYKNCYLQFAQEEKLHRVVILKVKSLIYLMIYEFHVNSLNDPGYYQPLAQDLIKLQMMSHVVEHHGFYFIFQDKSKNSIETNLPFIPKEDVDNGDDSLTNCRSLSLIIHRDLINGFGSMDEKLKSVKDGWWCYSLHRDFKSLWMLKRRTGGVLEDIGMDGGFVERYMG